MKTKIYKIFALAAIMSSVACTSAQNKNVGSDSGIFAMSVSDRKPVTDIKDYLTARSYAKTNSYYTEVDTCLGTLKPGMSVAFSTSYGANGGEAGQSRGVLVEKNGSLYYQQKENTTKQLLLPPGDGSHVNGVIRSGGVSDWDVVAFSKLACKVAFADQLPRSYTGADMPVYERIGASVVNFTGGTAGKQVSYSNALELQLKKTNADRSESNVSIYFAKDTGAVALEFKESGMVGGTAKVYLGGDAR